MAKKNGTAKLPARVSPTKTIMVPLTDIVSNVAQSRKTGVLHRLQEMGYPIFAPRKKKGQEEPEGLVWEALCSEEDPKRAAMIALIDGERARLRRLRHRSGVQWSVCSPLASASWRLTSTT
jgi:hypothetical protein